MKKPRTFRGAGRTSGSKQLGEGRQLIEAVPLLSSQGQWRVSHWSPASEATAISTSVLAAVPAGGTTAHVVHHHGRLAPGAGWIGVVGAGNRPDGCVPAAVSGRRLDRPNVGAIFRSKLDSAEGHVPASRCAARFGRVTLVPSSDRTDEATVLRAPDQRPILGLSISAMGVLLTSRDHGTSIGGGSGRRKGHRDQRGGGKGKRQENSTHGNLLGHPRISGGPRLIAFRHPTAQSLSSALDPDALSASLVRGLDAAFVPARTRLALGHPKFLIDILGSARPAGLI
jgi:hypothetical protein